MHSIKLLLLLGAASLIFQSASGLRAGTIYTWTDKNGAVHITETPPPPGAAVEDALSNPPESPAPVQPGPPPQPQSIGLGSPTGGAAGPAGPRAAGGGETEGGGGGAGGAADDPAIRVKLLQPDIGLFCGIRRVPAAGATFSGAGARSARGRPRTP